MVEARSRYAADQFEQMERDRIGREMAEAFFGPSYEVKHKVLQTFQKPRCANCGRTYGKRGYKYQYRHYAIGQPIEPYRGDEILVEEKVYVGSIAGPGHQPGARVERTTWTGNYYASSFTDPFCTGTCALSFARKAYEAGYRTVREDEE